MVAAGPVVVPVTAAPLAGTRGIAAETAIATTAVEAQNVALVENAAALQTAGAAASRDAARTVANAKAHEQATRAVEAQVASLAGVRGAVLTSSTPFLLATAAAVGLAKALKEASDTAEETNKAFQVFGSSAKEIEDFAKTTASSLGISELEALKATGIFGNLFRTIHIATPTAADMSEQLVRLASDLASFNNADPSRVLEALRSGLVGQARPLRVFGIFISQARAQQEALIETGKKNVKELTNSELVQARYNIILKDSAIAQGDFARTSDRLANQTRILRANLANAASTIGTILVPVLTSAARSANEYLQAIQKAADATNRFAKSLHIAGSEASQSTFLGNLLHTASRNLVDDARELSAAAQLLSQGKLVKFGQAPTQTLRDLNAAAERTKESIPAARDRIADLFKAFQQGGGRGSATALNEFVLGLQKLEQEEAKGLVTNDQLAARIRNLIKQLQDPNAFNINIQAVLHAEGLKQSANAALTALQDTLSPQAARAIGLDFMENLGEGAKSAAPKAGADAGKAFVLNLSSQVAVAQATGSDSQQLSALRARLAKRQEFLQSLLTGDRPVTQALLQRAAANVEADKNAIQAILDRQASTQKDLASQAAQTQADATQAFIDSFAGQQQRLQNRLSRAQVSGTAKQQIALNKAIISADKDEIDAIQARIRHLKLHGDALKIARAAIQALNQEIFNTRNSILELQAQRKQALVDARQAHLEAQLAIAETTASTKDDTAAEKALIKFDQAQIRRILAIKRRRRLTQEEAAQLDAYRVDLAQRNAALKKTKETVEDTGKKFKELTFAFLQTQQGFAANLLGNLIPGFATGGLVGGSQAAAGPRPGDNLSLGIPAQGVSADVAGSAALASGRDRGVRPVQVDTTNHLLRQILKSLQNLNGRAGHPEARHQKAVSGSALDTV